MRRLKTLRHPPIYPKSPGHLPCSSLTHPLPLPSRRPSVSFGGFGLRDYGEDTEAFRVERYLAMVELARGESNWRDYAGMLRTILVEFDSLLGRVNMQQDAIRLMTVHGAKGLQFPVVFVPDLCNSAFPNLYFKQNIAEERRLLFVAITRTQEVLHVSWTEVGPSGHPTAASPFVDGLVEDSGDIIETIT